MNKRLYGKRRWYNDPKNDDFVNLIKNHEPIITGNYKYLPGKFGRICNWIVTHLIARPVFFLIGKLGFRLKVIGKKNLKKVKALKNGYVAYGNHVHYLDAPLYYISTIQVGRAPHVLVSSDAYKMWISRKILPRLGAMPLPEDRQSLKNFTKSVDDVLASGESILILPEGHLWPCFAGVRRFVDTSFRYASRNNVPVVPLCLTWRKRKFSILGKWAAPCISIHIGEPMFAPSALDERAAAKWYATQVYEWMAQRANTDENYAVVNYTQTDYPVNFEYQFMLNKMGVEYTP